MPLLFYTPRAVLRANFHGPGIRPVLGFSFFYILDIHQLWIKNTRSCYRDCQDGLGWRLVAQVPLAQQEEVPRSNAHNRLKLAAKHRQKKIQCVGGNSKEIFELFINKLVFCAFRDKCIFTDYIMSFH